MTEETTLSIRQWAHKRAKRNAVCGLAVTSLALALAGCSGVKEQLGITREAPDEFTVVTKAPLVLPPNFTLRPPQPGAPPRGDQAAQVQAREALVSAGRPAPTQAGDGSKGEDALLSRAGAANAESDIRAVIDKETSLYAERERGFIDSLIFWREKEEPATVVDATKEQQRLRENAALGRPANEGEVPVIRYRKRGLLEGIF